MNSGSLQTQDEVNALSLYRKLLAIGGSVYLIWWFAVELLFPEAFNPFLSRLSVVSLIYVVFAASFVSPWVQRHLRILFVASAWLITLHYFYLFYGNQGDINWVVGCYITVMALSLYLLSSASLISYSAFVVLLSGLLVYLIPSLTHSVFLPGLITIVLQSYIGLRSRFGLIKNLTDSNERFQLLFNSTFEGVLVHEKGRILDVNDALVNLLGYSRQELIGAELLTLLPPEARPWAAEKMNSSDTAPFEVQAWTKNQKVLDVEVRAKDFNYGKLTARLVTIQDIGDRKQAEKERVATLALAENLRIRDDFISIASHELKTPLSSLHLQMQLLNEDLTSLGVAEKMAEPMSVFQRQINRLTELTESMLDVSRISAGRFVLHLQISDMAQIVRHIAQVLPDPQTLGPTRSHIDIESPERVFLLADPVRLEQLVENLLTNALKYGRGKAIHVRLTEEEKEVVLTVKDHGIGIAPEFVSHIFDRFTRAVSARNITGFGLGLYVVRQIVEAHGGTVKVESRLDVGSTFTVRLPKKELKTSDIGLKS